jgi:hypothetical protein
LHTAEATHRVIYRFSDVWQHFCRLVSPEWKQYRLAYHTSSKELAEIAAKAKPGLLILYHRANPGCDQARTEKCREAGSGEQLLKKSVKRTAARSSPDTIWKFTDAKIVWSSHGTGWL